MSNSSKSVYYLSIDGATEPLGNSQIVKYLELIAPSSRLEFVLVTLEKEESARDARLMDGMSARLDAAGVRWAPYIYSPGLVGTPSNLACLLGELIESDAGGENALVWARGYVPALAALTLKQVTGVPYVFDTRGYWFDERYAEGGIFQNPLFFALGKRLERQLFRESAGVIGLTNLVREDLENGKFGQQEVSSFHCTPTCAVYADFGGVGGKAEAKMNLIGHAPDRVIGYVGSINSAYEVEASFECARELLRRGESSHFVCLTRQTDLAEKLCSDFGIPHHRRTVLSVPHDSIGHWLRTLDFGLLLRGESFAKRASMPTKLAEFFAAGVRPITYPCNAEVRDWVERAGSGFVLRSVENEEIGRAVEWMLSVEGNSDLRRAREITAPHFDLASAYAPLQNYIEGLAIAGDRRR